MLQCGGAGFICGRTDFQSPRKGSKGCSSVEKRSNDGGKRPGCRWPVKRRRYTFISHSRHVYRHVKGLGSQCSSHTLPNVALHTPFRQHRRIRGAIIQSTEGQTGRLERPALNANSSCDQPRCSRTLRRLSPSRRSGGSFFSGHVPCVSAHNKHERNLGLAGFPRATGRVAQIVGLLRQRLMFLSSNRIKSSTVKTVALSLSRVFKSREIEQGRQIMDHFTIGELVRLRSSGPWMTVEGSEGTAITCVWFWADAFHRKTFDGAMLERQSNAQDQ